MEPSSIVPPSFRRGAVVVGGGPAGLAAALALAKVRGWSDVTLIEKNPELTWSDPDRAYVYGLTGRGQEAMKFLGLEDQMKEAGIPTTGFRGTIVEASGEVKKLSVGSFPTSYQMQRSTLMKILAAGLEAYNESALGTKVRVLTNSRVVKIDRVKGEEGRGETLIVLVKGELTNGGEEETVLYPSLVLGCDGINSVVRTTLEGWASEDRLASSTSRHVAHSFSLRKYPSPAAGLRFKVLRLPSTVVTRDGLALKPLDYGALIGSFKGKWMRIGVWQVKDPLLPRTCTMIMRPDHPFWKIPLGDVAAYRQMFREAFPQVDINAQVPDDVMLTFARSEGGVFPVPSASDGLAYIVKSHASLKHDVSSATSASPRAACAVVLAGDAAHSFPPDIGQGVNCAFQDVQVLTQCLEAAGDDVESAALAYQRERGPEAQAVARLMSLASPYFYNQAPWAARLWRLKFSTRLILSKVLGENLIAPPAAVMARDPSASYTSIMRREDQANWRIGLGLVTVVGAATAVIALKLSKQSLASSAQS